MSKKLESLFNLPPAPTYDTKTGEAEESVADAINNAQRVFDLADTASEKIDAALPRINDLESSDAEMDEIAKLATDTFNDLIEMSLNVDPRFSGTIIQSASTLLGHAVTAKMAKMNKKLKIVELQLKKAALDQKAPAEPAEEKVIRGEGIVIERTELLRHLLSESKNTK